MKYCDHVAERVALGESLAALAPHLEDCERCRRLVALPAQIGSLHKEHDPGLGFSARMTVGAQQRLALRHRRRLASGMGMMVAVGAAAVFVMTRSPSAQEPVANDQHQAVQPTSNQRPVAVEAGDLQMLVNLSDTQRAIHTSAPWGRIQRPLAPYKKLVKGVAQ